MLIFHIEISFGFFLTILSHFLPICPNFTIPSIFHHFDPISPFLRRQKSTLLKYFQYSLYLYLRSPFFQILTILIDFHHVAITSPFCPNFTTVTKHSIGPKTSSWKTIFSNISLPFFQIVSWSQLVSCRWLTNKCTFWLLDLR